MKKESVRDMEHKKENRLQTALDYPPMLNWIVVPMDGADRYWMPKAVLNFVVDLAVIIGSSWGFVITRNPWVYVPLLILLVVTIAINIRNARREEKRPSKGIRQ